MLVVNPIVKVLILENCTSSLIVILLLFLSTTQSFIITLVIVHKEDNSNSIPHIPSPQSILPQMDLPHSPTSSDRRHS